MLPDHWKGLPRLFARAVGRAEDVSKSQQVIVACWGDEPKELEYGDLAALDFHTFLAPAAREAGMTIPPIKWVNSVLPALSLLSPTTLVCKKCDEIGLQQVGRNWEALREGECPFCKTGVMVRPEVERAPLDWTTGLPMQPGRDTINVDGINIPLTTDGVAKYLESQLNEQIDTRFRGLNPLHVLNLLLNDARLTRINTPQDALEALAYPARFGLLSSHLQLLADRIERNEWLTGRGSYQTQERPMTTLTRASGSSDEFDRLVALASRSFPRDQALSGWMQSSERTSGKTPFQTLDALACRFGTRDSIVFLCQQAGVDGLKVPSHSDPTQMWAGLWNKCEPGSSGLTDRGFDRIVREALETYTHNPTLRNWVNSHERASGNPRQLIKELAGLYSTHTSASLFCQRVGIPRDRLPSMNTPAEFWQIIGGMIQNGII